MRPTVDNVYSRWRLLDLKTLTQRVYLLRGISMACGDVGLLKFLISHYDLSTSIFYTHVLLSRATSRTTKVLACSSLYSCRGPRDITGHGVLMLDV